MRGKWMGVILLLALILAGCGGGKHSDGGAPTSGVIDGIWETDGYGMVFELVGGKATIFETTKISGIKRYEGSYSNNQIRFRIGNGVIAINAGIEADKLVVYNNEANLYYRLTRIKSLPDVCKNGGTKNTADPVLSFDIFWNTFKEQYAFFQLRGVNWDALYQTYRSRINQGSTDDQLFNTLFEMIDPLQDAHVFINRNPEDEDSEDFRKGIDLGVSEEAMKQINAQANVVPIGSGYLSYKDVNQDIGLMNVFVMTDYSETSSTTAASKAVDEVIEKFKDKKTIIIDMRFNMGGSDQISLMIAGHFADRKRLAFSKEARNGEQNTPRREFYVEPQGASHFSGKVIVLTSRNTVSAGEIFIMAMRELPNVTIMGDNTHGSLSDILDRKLPNGWSFGLSNERYYAADGRNYEKVGIEPDVRVSFSLNDYDPVEKALEMAGNS